MLARVANNLFWMGRYIERTEHIARYLNVNYFSSLDAPNELSQSRQFVLRSMLFMANDESFPPDVNLNEEDVLYDIGLNHEKFYSVINYVKLARENANSARDLISTELYEALNRFYHFVLNYDKSHFVKNGLYDFTVQVTESTAVLRGKIRGTLLHDEVYAIIMLGINLERAMQIIRIVNSKYHDALIAKGSYKNPVKSSYEWITLLKCTESHDMMRRFYKKTPNSINTLEFLILNPTCPRSIMNCLNELSRHMEGLTKEKFMHRDSVAFLIGKVKAEYEYKHIEEIEGNFKTFIERIEESLTLIGSKMEKEYFTY